MLCGCGRAWELLATSQQIGCIHNFVPQAVAQQAWDTQRAVTAKLSEQLANAQKEHVEPDLLVAAQSPLHTQLINCVAEHAAIEDTLFYLSKALAKKLIPLQDYLTVCADTM